MAIDSSSGAPLDFGRSALIAEFLRRLVGGFRRHAIGICLKSRDDVSNSIQVKGLDLPKSSGAPFKFDGMAWDAAIGLYYDNARYYDPATGGFISQDPIGFIAGDADLYDFTNNSPTLEIDATGDDGSPTTGLTDWGSYFNGAVNPTPPPIGPSIPNGPGNPAPTPTVPPRTPMQQLNDVFGGLSVLDLNPLLSNPSVGKQLFNLWIQQMNKDPVFNPDLPFKEPKLGTPKPTGRPPFGVYSLPPAPPFPEPPKHGSGWFGLPSPIPPTKPIPQRLPSFTLPWNISPYDGFQFRPEITELPGGPAFGGRLNWDIPNIPGNSQLELFGNGTEWQLQYKFGVYW